jgi:hypothetical protein
MAQPQDLKWNESVDQAVADARNAGRSVLVDFTAAPM